MQQRDATTTFGKADFGDLYVQPDPRSYFRGLGALDYQVPHHGQLVFEPVLDALPVERPTIVDVCCSYGINAALLKHDLTLRDLYEHYCDDDLTSLTTDELIERDRAFYAPVRREDAPVVVGLDAAGPAVAYATAVGLLDHGAAVDLESSDPPPPLVEVLADADLVTVTGGIGYVTERTFDRLLGCVPDDRRPWVASLCLRTVPFEPIAECLSEQGLVTEHLEGVTFPQRRFADEAEAQYALTELDALGVDPTGREADGAYHVNVFLSRPPEDAADRPIGKLLGGIPDFPGPIT